MDYKEKHSFAKRSKEADRIRKKYPGRTPIIVLAPDELKLNKKKYLVPADLSMIHFQCVLRKRMETLNESESVFLFCGNSVVSMSSMMGQIDKEHRDKDGFLYVTISKESSFG